MKKLTKKQQLFANEYLIDLNATQAAIRAGYSEKTAQEQSSRLLSKVIVQEFISVQMKKREKRTEITQDRVLNEIAKLAFSNIQDIYDENGELINIPDMQRDVSAAIQEIVQDSIKSGDGEFIIKRKYKLSDKRASLEMLCRHLGMFKDKLDHTSSDKSMSSVSPQDILSAMRAKYS